MERRRLIISTIKIYTSVVRIRQYIIFEFLMQILFNSLWEVCEFCKRLPWQRDNSSIRESFINERLDAANASTDYSGRCLFNVRCGVPFAAA